MAPSALALFMAAAALAQVPSHSVVGTLTLDVVDLPVPVPYGQPETKAAISVCDTQESQRFQILVNTQEPSGNTFSLFFDIPANKIGAVYCVSVVATVARADIPSIDVQKVAHFVAPPPASVTPAAAKTRK